MKIMIDHLEYEIVAVKETITIPDCFVVESNKIGTGHGEAKLYVGLMTDKETNDFFAQLPCQFVYKKDDLLSYLRESENEYLFPSQNYKNIDNMPIIYGQNLNKIKSLESDFIYFTMFKVDVKPPRIYLNSISDAYHLIREIALSNLSYLSILKLKREETFLYYLRLFFDREVESDNHKNREINEEDLSLSPRQKETLMKARIGQGKYREQLLSECPYCPITLVNDKRLLVASHIQPWSVSTNFEKVDPKNGFMFTPTYDKLFDQGFISFSDEGIMLISPWLSSENQKRLSLEEGKKFSLPIKGRDKYLKYHREHVFKK